MTTEELTLERAVDVEGWEDFAGRHWEQGPCVMDRAPAPLSFGADEVLDALRLVTPTRDGGPTRPAVRFYCRNAAETCDLGRFMPTTSDHSVNEYAETLRERVDGPYMLVVNGLQLVDPSFWKRSREFLSGLWEVLGGLPSGGVNLNMFFGEYPCTPFGIHRDPSADFAFIVWGVKDILVWPRDTSGLPVETRSFDEARPTARVLRAEAGQLMYWSAQDWHVGEARQGPALALHLTINWSGDTGGELYDAARQVLQRRGSGSQPLVRDFFDPQRPAEAVRFEDRQGLAAALLDEEAGRQVAEGSMRRTTAGGFAYVPQRAAVPELSDAERVRVEPGFPVLALRDGGELSLSGNGHLARVPAPDLVEELLTALHSSFHEVGELKDLARSDSEREVVAGVLDLLTSWRSLVREGPLH
jgi:50S ribosomal protein L16 3-hydroxylase